MKPTPHSASPQPSYDTVSLLPRQANGDVLKAVLLSLAMYIPSPGGSCATGCSCCGRPQGRFALLLSFIETRENIRTLNPSVLSPKTWVPVSSISDLAKYRSTIDTSALALVRNTRTGKAGCWIRLATCDPFLLVQRRNEEKVQPVAAADQRRHDISYRIHIYALKHKRDHQYAVAALLMCSLKSAQQCAAVG